MLRGLHWVCDSSSGKIEDRVGIQIPSTADYFLGSYSLIPPHGGNLKSLTTGILIVIKKWGEACNNQHSDLKNKVPTCSIQVVISTSRISHLAESNQWHSLTKELGRLQACVISTSNKDPCRPWSLSLPTGELCHSLVHYCVQLPN